VCAIGIDAGAGAGWLMATPAMATGSVETLTPSYSSPSAAAKDRGPFIEKEATATDGASRRMMNGARINSVLACGYQSAAKMTPLYAYLAARVGLTIDLS
jgi:hypothetical protein